MNYSELAHTGEIVHNAKKCIISSFSSVPTVIIKKELLVSSPFHSHHCFVSNQKIVKVEKNILIKDQTGQLPGIALPSIHKEEKVLYKKTENSS